MSKRPTVLACGMGVNTIGLLAEFVRRKQPIDAILFGDTGGEHEWVYRYIPILSAWLVERSYPPVTVVRHARADGSIETLEEECLRTGRLPSLAYGSSRRCSGKYKMEPQDKWLNHWQPALDAWTRKERVIKLIGYDADEQYRIDTADEWNDERYLAMWRDGATFIDIARHFAGPVPTRQEVYESQCNAVGAALACGLDAEPLSLDDAFAQSLDLHEKLVRSLVRKVTATCKYEKQYPLVELGWGRDECMDSAKRAGLEANGTACFFCPASTEAEIKALPPPLQVRSLRIEKRALEAGGLLTVKGLGRSFAWDDVINSRQVEMEFGRPDKCRVCADGGGIDDDDTGAA